MSIIIKEIDVVSSREDDVKWSSGKVQKNQSSVVDGINMDTQKTSTNDSLLDVMHKRYCPSQYNKPQQSEEICINTNASSRLILKPLQPISTPFYNGLATCDAHDYGPVHLSPNAAWQNTQIVQPTGTNLTSLLPPFVPLPSLPCTPVSMSPAGPLESPLSSPENCFYDNLFNVGCANTRSFELRDQFNSKQNSGHDDSNSAKVSSSS